MKTTINPALNLSIVSVFPFLLCHFREFGFDQVSDMAGLSANKRANITKAKRNTEKAREYF